MKMFKYFFLFTILLVYVHVSNSYPQLGIKTHQLPTGNLVQNTTGPHYSINNISNSVHQSSENPEYKNLYPNLSNRSTHYFPNRQHEHDHPHSVNPIDSFRNRTRQSMSAGICDTEVPTISLVKDPKGHIPAGNGSNPSMSRIQVCCEGYEQNPHNYRKCDPICRNECINGLCVAPDTCSCYPDHVKNLGRFCIPTCPIGCANGDCLRDGKCSCKSGFILEINGKYCIPKCSKGCGHGNCTAPETCECNPGYHVTSDNQCAPTCSEGCLNGDCVAPGVCHCRSGYVKYGHICEPICSKGCINGKCTAPDICSCNRGWTLDSTGTECVAHCENFCLNGYCSGPNECTCNRGYILDEFNPSMCKAHCPAGCPNGQCTGPNMCLCNPGFIKDRSIKGSQRCIRT